MPPGDGRGPAGGVAVWARVTRGVEWVCAAEVRGRLGGRITGRGHRSVLFDVPQERLQDVLLAATADDVFIWAGTAGGIGRTRSSLGELSGRVDVRGVVEAADLVRLVRPVADRPAFDVSASFLGSRNFNRYELEDAVGTAVAGHTGWLYSSRSASAAGPPPQLVATSFSIRVHVDHEEAMLGVRVGDAPLHRRSYKRNRPTGTLHPPVAAALALLAGLRPGSVLFDPYCGAGTIAIEAAKLEPAMLCMGADADAGAVAGASENAVLADTTVRFAVADAHDAPLPDGSISRVVTNPPWGRTVPARRGPGGARPAAEVCLRLVEREGRTVVLNDAETEAASGREGLTPLLSVRMRVSGRVAVASVATAGSGSPIDPKGLLGPELSEELETWEPLQASSSSEVEAT